MSVPVLAIIIMLRWRTGLIPSATHAAATQVTAAKALQRKGNRFCASKKQAQGIRMLANALKLLGVTPIDPVQ